MISVFSKKLYWEGVKKTRVIGIAFAAISAILCGLVPLVNMLNWYAYDPKYRTTTSVNALSFSLPALLIIMPAALIIVLNMFSYLNKRSESDFYHAIPYKRSCVYISFMAACLSWLVLTALLSTLTAALFWWIHPGATVGLSIPFLNLGICILLGITLAATTAVAMTLTGTVISNLLILCLLICFTPVVGFLFITLLGEVVPLLYVPLTPARFLQPEFSLPLAVLGALMMYEEQLIFGNAPMIVYTVIVTLIQLVAGCLFYMFRKSEMASKSAPNNILQHIYRCAVTLPFALLAVMILWLDSSFSLFIVLAVIALLVYFMYELITTKRFKNLLKATPFLGVLVAGCLLFVGSAQLTKMLTLTYTPDADDLVSIGQISSNDMMLYGSIPSYEELQTAEIEIDSKEAFEIVADALKDSVEHCQNGTFYYYDYRYDISDPENEPTYRMIKITDKSGKVCGRYLRLTMQESNRLYQLFLESDHYADALLKMPSEQEIQNINAFGGNSYNISESDLQKLWQSLLDEYNDLSEEEKLAYKSDSGLANGDHTVEIIDKETVDSSLQISSELCYFDISGTVGSRIFNSTYSLRPDLFPKTAALYASIINDTKLDHDDPYYSQTFGADNMQELLPQLDSEDMSAFTLRIGDSLYFSHDEYDRMKAEEIAELKEIVEFVLSRNASAAEAEYYIVIDLDITLNESYHANQTIIGMSEADFGTLSQMINDYYNS